MYSKIITSFIFTTFFMHVVWAQTPVNDDCSTAVDLCAKIISKGTNSNATIDVSLNSKLCFKPTNGVWYSFLAIQNGTASIQLSGIQSKNSNTKIQLAILNFTTECDFSNLQVLACDSSYKSNLTVSASNLIALNRYFVYVDGQDSIGVSAGEFDYSLDVSGTAVNPDITTITEDATCNKTTGKVIITNVSLSTPPYTYQLNGGVSQSDSIYDNLAPGTYSITVSDLNGCTYTQNIKVNNVGGVSSIAASSINADCATSQNGSISLDVQPNNVSYTYAMDGAISQSSSFFSNVAAGTHFITISGQQCDTTISVIVSLNGGVTSATGVGKTIPCGAINGSISYPNPVLPNPPPVGSQYIFKLVGSNQQNTTGAFVNLKAGTYKIQVFNSNNPTCIYTDIVNVAQLPGPAIDTVISVNDVCSDKNGKLIVNAKDGIAPYTYSIGGASFSQANQFNDLPKGSYIVIVKDANNCTSSKQVTLKDVSPGTFSNCNAGLDQKILSGYKANVEVIAPTGATITWQPNTASVGVTDTSFKLYPIMSTNYIMTVTMPNGCVCSDAVTVTVEPKMDIPNTFTPNGDDKNDTFLIHHTESFRDVEVTIFDRWGNKVYHTSNYTDSEAWDGKSSGTLLPVATYYYIIRFKYPLGMNDDNIYYYEGSVALLR